MDWFHAVRVRLTKIQATTKPDHLWPEMWSRMSKAAQRTEKQQWAIAKPKLDNAGKSRGIHFFDPEEIEFKETMKEWNQLTNLRESVWKGFYQKITKLTLRKKKVQLVQSF